MIDISRKLKIILSALLTAAVMTTIFIFSSQNGTQSSGVSTGFGRWFLGILGIDIPPGQSVTDVKIIFGLNIRNLAHVFLYFCLGLSSFLLAESLWGVKAAPSPSRALLSALCSLAFGLIYACTDELHQYFVGGRSATLRDVGIDCIGIALAEICCVGVQCIIYCVQHKRAGKDA